MASMRHLCRPVRQLCNILWHRCDISPFMSHFTRHWRDIYVAQCDNFLAFCDIDATFLPSRLTLRDTGARHLCRPVRQLRNILLTSMQHLSLCVTRYTTPVWHLYRPTRQARNIILTSMRHVVTWHYTLCDTGGYLYRRKRQLLDIVVTSMRHLSLHVTPHATPARQSDIYVAKCDNCLTLFWRSCNILLVNVTLHATLARHLSRLMQQLRNIFWWHRCNISSFISHLTWHRRDIYVA
jgi:hypothetical protein